MRSIRLATTLSGVIAYAAGCYFVYRMYVWIAPRYLQGTTILALGKLAIPIVCVVFAYSYLLLMHAGRFDPVVAWAANAWRNADYGSAVFRVRVLSWRDRRAPFLAFLLTSANLPQQAYLVATRAKLPETDMEEPSYDLGFAAGRAALALGDLDEARRHFDRLYERFPHSALARYALGDLLLWQNQEAERADELLTGALADSDRHCLPHWNRLGFEAELRASHAWSLAVMGKAEELQDDLDQAIALAGRNKPVLAAVHLRLGFALRSLNHLAMAHQYWRAAVEVDPHGWAGNQAARELERVVTPAGAL